MVRKIEYTVSESGIAPAVSQFGGVQGEHQATELVFKIADELWAKLNSLKVNKGGRLVYRIDGYDGEGGEHNSDTKDLEQSISYFLEEALTFAGGNIRVVLVITLIKEDKTEMELYSFPALLKLKNRPFGFKRENESRESMSTLAEVAKNAAEQTEQDRDFVEAAEKRVAENLVGYIPLNANLEIIFDGGDSSATGEMFKTAVVNRILETADYVVQEGTSDNWTYRKWNSGVAECWFSGSVTIGNPVSTGITNIFLGSADVPTPFAFKNTDSMVCFASCKWNFTEWVEVYPQSPTVVKLRKFGNGNSFNITNGTPADTHNHKVSIYVKGYWK
ncbi:MAG: hypothetical protein J6D52_02830 [Clostridia bacterium]|nr:hypothetical protein [Clostridia bacterium]